MNFIEYVAEKMGYTKKSAEIVGGETKPTERPIWAKLSQLSNISKPYSQSAWVYASIHKTATSLSALDLDVYKDIAGRKKKLNPITDKSASLISQPNVLHDSREWILLTIIYFLLKGQFFWHLVRANETALPESIFVLNPDNMRYFPSDVTEHGLITKWYYRNPYTNREIVIPYWQIVNEKFPDPDNPIAALAPSTPLTTKINLDAWSDRFNENFFKNGGKLGGIIEVPGELSNAQYNKLRADFNAAHSGLDNANKIGLLEGGAKFTDFSAKQKDMEFTTLKKMSREEIFSIYGANSIVLGLFEDVKSYEGIRAGHQIYWEDALIPLARMIQRIINKQILMQPSRGKETVEFNMRQSPVYKAMIKDLANTAFLLWKMGWPINMINERLDLGMDYVPWGDKWWGASSTVDIIENQNPDDSQPLPTSGPRDPSKDVYDEKVDDIPTKLFDLQRELKSMVEQYKEPAPVNDGIRKQIESFNEDFKSMRSESFDIAKKALYNTRVDVKKKKCFDETRVKEIFDRESQKFSVPGSEDFFCKAMDLIFNSIDRDACTEENYFSNSGELFTSVKGLIDNMVWSAININRYSEYENCKMVDIKNNFKILDVDVNCISHAIIIKDGCDI